MEQHDINIDAVLQLPYPTKGALPFVVTVEACPPSVVADAVRQIGASISTCSRRWICPC